MKFPPAIAVNRFDNRQTGVIYLNHHKMNWEGDMSKILLTAVAVFTILALVLGGDIAFARGHKARRYAHSATHAAPALATMHPIDFSFDDGARLLLDQQPV
jgi:hypothetical protein